MPKKYLSGRVERTSQTDLTDDRYEYLGLEQAEPNLGDPSVIVQTLPIGQQYQVISVLGSPGNRFWIPVSGGLIPGAITVYDEGVIVPTNAGVSSITQVNFVGAAISAKGYVYADGSPGIGVTITVFSPGNNQQLLFNNNNEFGTSSLLTFDNVTGILTAGKALNVGIGGTVITATSIGLVGIGTTNPTQELDINGDIKLRGTIYDYNNQPGVNQQVLIKNNFGGLEWNNQSSVRAGAGGTYTQVQYHSASGLVDGATSLVYDPNTNRVGIGSTLPRYILDVIGNVNISGLATITNLYVSGIGTFNDIVYVISTEQSTSTSTGALVVSGGVGIAKNLNVGGVAGISSLNVTNHTTSGSLYVSGISTLGVTTATNLTAQQLNVSGISTLGVTSATNLTSQTLVVSGISTLGVTSTTNLTSQTLVVSGISTLGVTSTTDLTSQQLNVSGISTLGVTSTTNLTSQSIVVSGISTFYGNILPGSNGFYDIGSVLYKFNEVYADTFIGQIVGNSETATVATNVNGGTGNLTALNVSGISTLGVTSATNLTSQSLVVSGNGTITTLNSTNGTITNLTGTAGTITTFNSTNGTITNLTGTAGTITTFNSTNGTITNLTGTGVTYTNGTITNLTGTAGTITNLNSTNGTITNLNSTNGTITNLTGTAGTITTFNSTNGTITTLNSTNGTITNLTGTNLNITGISTFQGNVTLGDANTDKVSFGATVDSNIIPSGSRDLGSVANPWSNVYATTITGTIAGNAATATKLLNGKTIAITGDLAYTSPAFDGSSNVTGVGTLATVNSNVGTFGSGSQVATFTVDAKGRLTAASNTTITQANGLTTARTIAITGDLAYTSPAFDGSSNVTAAGTLATVNSNVGTFGSSTFVPQITVNAKGLVTGISSVGVNFTTATVAQANGLTTARTIAITGDLAYTSPAFDGSSNVTGISTLATVNSTTGTFGSSTQVPVFAVDAKGRITSVTNTGVNFTTATVAQADKLTTARTIAITGDLAYTSSAFDGTGNITAAGTLATVNSTTGTFGSSTQVPVFAVDAKGRITSVTNTGVNFTTATVAQANGLTTARTIAITGDLAYTSPAFDGTGNVTATGTLAATTVVAGSYGSGSQVATFTVDAKGRLTAASNTSITGINASSVAAAGADTQIQFNDGGAFAGDADFTFAKTTNTVTTRFLALNGNGSTTSAQLAFNGGTNNWITFGTTGVAAPAFTTRSVGTKIVLYDGIGASSADYGFGIESSTLWSSVPTTSNQFKWYGGTTLAATLSGAGAFTAVGAISGTQLNGTLQYALTLNTSGTGLSGSTTYNNSGAATFTVTSNATSANTASAIVARDASGNFSAGTITASLTGTASNVTTNANLTGHVTSVGNAAVLGSFTSAQLATALTDETGSGSAVFATSPTLVTPALGTPSSGDLTNCTSLNASQLSTGTVPTARLASGTANSSTYLRGDQTWQSISAEFASGTTIVFYQASAPTGWTKSTSHDNKALRVVSGTGGGSGGSSSFTSVFASRGVPLLEHNHSASSSNHDGHQHSGPTNSQSIDHNHSFTTGNQSANHTHTFTTGNQNADHNHGFTTNGVGDHNHLINGYITANEAGGYGLTFSGGFENRVLVTAPNGQGTTYAGAHSHDGATAGQSANHQHGGTTAGMSDDHNHSGTTSGGGGSHSHDFTTQSGGSHNHSISVSNNGTASASMDFAVQYIDVIICSKN